jgi:hypothetical protein
LATSDSVASVIAIVARLRWRASFIARLTSGCGRPADSPMTSVASSMRASRPSASCDGEAGDLGAQVEQHEQVAQVRGEERHLVGADDEHAGRRGDRLHRGVDLRARRLAGRLLDVGVVGGQRGLERALVQAEQRRGLGPTSWRRRYSSRAEACSSG